jgi:type II secretory pathway pseudopilin PulG
MTHRRIPNSEFRIPNSGFTLLETVTAIGIFVLVITTVVNLYLVYSSAQRASGQRQRIVSEAGALLDQIAQEIRTLELAYWGTFNYDNTGAAEYLYQVDVAGSPGTSETNPYTADIVDRERELVLYDAKGNTNPNDDMVIAYAFNQQNTGAAVDLCAGEAGQLLYPAGTIGLFRLVRDGNGAVACQRLFGGPGLDVTDAGFFFTQPVQPYPDAVDPPTDPRPGSGDGLDADCGPAGTASKFNGYYCTCAIGSHCFSGGCDLTTGGRCTFGPNRQPAVTVSLTVRDLARPNQPVTLQTTVTQRRWQR